MVLIVTHFWLKLANFEAAKKNIARLFETQTQKLQIRGT